MVKFCCAEFVCQRCLGVACPIDGRPVTHVDVDGTQLDVEATFCYLGDMFSAGGGCHHAIAARCCAAWGKFRKLLPILTSKHISLRYAARCSQLAFGQLCFMVVRPGTWAPNASDLQWLRRNDHAMIRWICGAKLEDKISSAVLHQKLDLDEITAVLRTRRLRWYGHDIVPLRASTPSRDWGFQAPEIVGGQGRHGPHVSEMI